MGINHKMYELDQIISDFKAFHSDSLPLCAAENVISQFSKLPLQGDFQERYIMGNSNHFDLENNFIGSQYLLPFYQLLDIQCRQLFHAEYSDARTLSGMNCLTTVLMSMTNIGDKIMILPNTWGGHPSVKPVCERLGLVVYDAPYDLQNYDLDYDKTNSMIYEEKIPFILLAPSDLIKPFEVDKLDLSKAYLIYDASQILGLIAGKVIKNPLDDIINMVMIGGTHKTLPGPTSGLILTNNRDIREKIEEKINPEFLRNPQMHQIISLLFSLIEFEVFGVEYSNKIIHTSNTLAKELVLQGFEVSKLEKHFTETHQVFLETNEDEANVIYKNAIRCGVTLNKKKKALFKGHGIRLGTQEVSRYNWADSYLTDISHVLSLLRSKECNEKEVRHLIKNLPEKTIQFKFKEKDFYTLENILHQN